MIHSLVIFFDSFIVPKATDVGRQSRNDFVKALYSVTSSSAGLFNFIDSLTPVFMYYHCPSDSGLTVFKYEPVADPSGAGKCVVAWASET